MSPASAGAANEVPLHTPKPPEKSSASIEPRSGSSGFALRTWPCREPLKVVGMVLTSFIGGKFVSKSGRNRPFLLVGIGLERGIIKHFYKRSHAEQILVTFGLAIPYYAYWTFKYFFTNMEIELYER